MESYTNRDAYLKSLRSRSTSPVGFRFGVHAFGFSPLERDAPEPMRMNLAAAVLDDPTETFAGVFTRNRFPGAPVVVGRERLHRRLASGVLVNNRIANVCAPGGVDDARTLTARFARLLGRGEDEIFPASTGIIGWKLPVDDMVAGIAPLVEHLGSHDTVDLASAIMTTDSYPKLRSARIGKGTLVGVAKGAGMIEPNMGTLLVFLFTDVRISRERLAGELKTAVDESFNTISVDGDQSTSDTVLAFSSNRVEPARDGEFAAALRRVCRDLAMDVVRNGEGTEHVIRVTVGGAPSRMVAMGCAKAVVNSPLVKTAVCGNDPNVGRIVGAVGDYFGSCEDGVGADDRGPGKPVAGGIPGEPGDGECVGPDPERVRVSIGDEAVFERGVFALNPRREVALSEYFRAAALPAPAPGYPVHDRVVEIAVDLGMGQASGTAVGSDLTHGYVSENADYRS